MSRVVRATGSVLALVSLVAAVSLGGGGLAGVGVRSAWADDKPPTVSAIPGGYAVTFSGDDKSYSFEVSTDPLSAVGTGGGWIEGVNGVNVHASFGFVVELKSNGSTRGHLVYRDHSFSPPFTVTSTSSPAVLLAGCAIQFVGIGDSNATPDPVVFTVQAIDNGEPGTGRDSFTIQVSGGYADIGLLMAGNIQAHGFICPP